MNSTKKEINVRVDEALGGRDPLGDGLEFSVPSIQYKIPDRTHAISYGGIGAMHQVTLAVGFITAINTRRLVVKRCRPYSEADHILNIAYGVMFGLRVLKIQPIVSCAGIPLGKVDKGLQRANLAFSVELDVHG